jgi:hypothetical protein
VKVRLSRSIDARGRFFGGVRFLFASMVMRRMFDDRDEPIARFNDRGKPRRRRNARA